MNPNTSAHAIHTVGDITFPQAILRSRLTVERRSPIGLQLAAQHFVIGIEIDLIVIVKLIDRDAPQIPQPVVDLFAVLLVPMLDQACRTGRDAAPIIARRFDRRPQLPQVIRRPESTR
jgi:hypothetical protein